MAIENNNLNEKVFIITEDDKTKNIQTTTDVRPEIGMLPKHLQQIIEKYF